MGCMSGNRIARKEGKIDVYLNIPDSFIYDINEVVVEYDEVQNKVRIISEMIPASIRGNMEMYFKGDIEKYVQLLEYNLETFFKGECPEICEDAENGNAVVLRPFELPRSHRFVMNRNVVPNVRIEFDKNMSFVVCERLNIQVECNRCKRKVRAHESVDCAGCMKRLDVLYIPTLCTEFVGFLKLGGCSLILLDTSKYQFSCDNCQMNYETNELGVGDVFSMKCYECFSSLYIKITKMMLIENKKGDMVRPGHPLPNDGACKHYKRSYRWFRFPCCNSLYPCDVCHDEGNQHVHEMANKMVCGLCSKEQGVTKECACGMKMNRSTTFWEGGKGSRNKATMSKKDKKKYSK
ncbi:putative CHY-type domain-containing protein [Ordospora pajunii]|uniref:putative CHY-type domain-containing protein n=1 Tax=Ordospora pajunii TaxID=3039483 RepID=UPI00295275C6|nr:putative CHY-type domain-containing protein [Ordospora pajunii]KAH9410688.1 putative CHY-type domain-containing protein [Ordospora pajunii]